MRHLAGYENETTNLSKTRVRGNENQCRNLEYDRMQVQILWNDMYMYSNWKVDGTVPAGWFIRTLY